MNNVFPSTTFSANGCFAFQTIREATLGKCGRLRNSSRT